jgi:hypothetical protein
VLALQGVGWLTRKAIGLSPITQEIKQYTDASGIEHIDVESILPGGLKSVECRILDDSEHHEKDDLFGYIGEWYGLCTCNNIIRLTLIHGLIQSEEASV